MPPRQTGIRKSRQELGTNASYTIAQAQPSHAGRYSVRVTNALGSTTSSEAVLTVETTKPVSSVLLFVDGAWPSLFQPALTNLGLPFQRFTNESTFAQAVSAASCLDTLLVVDAEYYNDTITNQFRSAENFVVAGGRAILRYYALADSPTLAAAFDATFTATCYTPGLPVYDWGGSPFFTGLSSPLNLTNRFFDLHGECLGSTAGGQAVAGWTGRVDPYQGALIIGNANRTVLNGFPLGEITSPAEAIRLAQNEIQFFLPETPRITVQPASQTVKQGSNATFNVMATGSAPLAYQWFFNDTNLPGATQTALTVSNVTPAKAGPYFVVVSNVYGAVTSQVATLEILIPPVFIAHPQSQTVPAGTEVAFTVSVTGTLPIGYRWRRGTTLTNMVLNENTCTLTVPSALTTTAGVYTVVVTNLAGAATGGPQAGISSNAYLTVVVPPTNQAIAVGSNATLSAQAYGGSGNTLRFQWRLDGTNLPGATSTNLTLSGLQTSQAGTYTFVVTNGAGQATGFDAVLTVLAPEGPTINCCALLASGGFQLQFDGATGASYTVLVSSNLTSWEVLGAATEAAPGSFEFTDAEAPDHACRFYRLLFQSR